MGQRLTIQIFQNKDQEQPLATLYYHWSAYTESALEELKTFYNNYSHYFANQKQDQKVHQDHHIPDEVTTQENNLDTIVTSIYQSVVNDGGGFAFDEGKKAIQLYPVLNKYYDPKHSPNRNNGIVAFTKEEQDHLYYWSEGNIKLYLHEQEFTFNVYWSYDVANDQEYFENLTEQWFGTKNINNITNEQIIDYCTKNLPKFDTEQYHKLDDIDALISIFEQNTVFYDNNSETIIDKIY